MERLTYGEMVEQLYDLSYSNGRPGQIADAEVRFIDLGDPPTEFVARRVALAHHPLRVELWGERVGPLDEDQAKLLREAP